MARPSFGKSGRPIPLITNCFEVKPPRNPAAVFIYQYDLVVTNKEGRTLPRVLNRHIFQTLVRGVLQGHAVAYDGTRLVFSNRKLDVPEAGLQGTVSVDSDHKLGAKDHFSYKLIHTAEFSLNQIRLLLSPTKPPSAAAFNDALAVLQALNVIFKHPSAMKWPSTLRRYYPEVPGPEGKNDLEAPLPDGVVLRKGFFAQVRPALHCLLLNLNTVSGTFLPSPPPRMMGNFAEVCLMALGSRDRFNPASTHLLEKVSPMDQVRLWKHFGKGKTRILIQHSSQYRGIVRKFFGLGPPANAAMFDLGGVQITVKDYWERKYNNRVNFPGLPCVKISKQALIPMEFCHLPPNQMYGHHLNSRQQQAALHLQNTKPIDIGLCGL